MLKEKAIKVSGKLMEKFVKRGGKVATTLHGIFASAKATNKQNKG